jgi:rRNA processing protein Krr1/Pno1
VQDISLAVKVDKRQVKDLKTLIGQVEKQVGALNKVKVTLDTSPAKRNLDRLTEQLKQAETVANRFFGSNPIRKGLGAFSNCS